MATATLPYKTYNPIIDFFRLRPEVGLFFLSLAGLLLFIRTFVLIDPVDESEFQDTRMLEMIEIEIPAPPAAAPEVQTPEEAAAEEPEEEEEKMEFGKEEDLPLNALAGQPAKLMPGFEPPSYPTSLQKLGIEGVVFLELGIDEKGNTVFGKIKRGLHPVLDKLVLDWMKTAKFFPALDEKGNAFKAKIILPIRYQLN